MRQYRSFYEVAAATGAAVIVGGQALSPISAPGWPTPVLAIGWLIFRSSPDVFSAFPRRCPPTRRECPDIGSLLDHLYLLRAL